MKIEIGKYRTRDGRIATITRNDYTSARGRHVFQFTGKVEGEGDPKAWPVDGRWYVGGEDHGLDLVERLIEISVGQYRTRDGRIADVTDMDGRTEFTARGYINGAPCIWTKYGRWTNYEGTHGSDLVERISNIADVPRTGKAKPNGFRFTVWAEKLAELTSDAMAKAGVPPGQEFEFLDGRGLKDRTLKLAVCGDAEAMQELAELDAKAAAAGVRPSFTYSAKDMTLTIDGVEFKEVEPISFAPKPFDRWTLAVRPGLLPHKDRLLEALKPLGCRLVREAVAPIPGQWICASQFTDQARPIIERVLCAFEVGKTYKCKDGTLRRVVRIDDHLHVEFPDNPGSTFKRGLDGSSEYCDSESLLHGAVPEPWTLEVSQRVYDLAHERLAKALKHLGCEAVKINPKFEGRDRSIPPVNAWEALTVLNTVLDRARVSTYRFKATKERPIDWARIVREAPKGWSKLVVRYGDNLQVSVSVNPAYPAEGMNRLKERELGSVRLTQNFGSAVRGPVEVEITVDI